MKCETCGREPDELVGPPWVCRECYYRPAAPSAREIVLDALPVLAAFVLAALAFWILG